MKLYELSAEYEKAKADMQEQGFDESTILDTLDGISEDVEEKLEKVALYRKGLDAEKSAINEEIKRLQARKKSVETEQEWLKGYICSSMKQCKLTKVKRAKVTISIIKGRQSLKLDIDPEKLPMRFRIKEIKCDKAFLTAELKAGRKVKGASLVTGEDSIQIR